MIIHATHDARTIRRPVDCDGRLSVYLRSSGTRSSSIRSAQRSELFAAVADAFGTMPVDLGDRQRLGRVANADAPLPIPPHQLLQNRHQAALVWAATCTRRSSTAKLHSHQCADQPIADRQPRMVHGVILRRCSRLTILLESKTMSEQFAVNQTSVSPNWRPKLGLLLFTLAPVSPLLGHGPMGHVQPRRNG